MKGHPWTKREIEKLVDLSLDGIGIRELARRLHRAAKTVHAMQIELELIKESDLRRRWTPAEIELFQKQYPHVLTATLAKRLRKSVSSLYGAATKFGVAKTEEFKRSAEACILHRDPGVGAPYRFKPGIVPHNKGVKRPGWSTGRMCETQFKKGERNGSAEKNWKPIGTVVADLEGFLRVKIADRVNGEPKGWDKKIWPLLSHLTWEEHHGPIPTGHKVAYRDGSRANCAIENLELLTDAQVMLRNTIHNLPPELKETIQLLGRVKRRIRKNAKKHDDGPAQPSI